MMRAVAGIAAGAAMVMVLMNAGCSAPEKAPNVFSEYARSTSVKNDKFPSTGRPEDRLANLAARGTPEQLLAQLLSASRCDAACDLNGPARKAVNDYGGSEVAVSQRSIVVKREDGSLELMLLYVARKPGDEPVLIDGNGETYRGGLDDFRSNNDLLSSDDWILAPLNITAVPGEGDVVTVTGHTAPTWHWWLIGAVVSVIVLGAGFGITRRLTARNRDLKTVDGHVP